MITDDNTHAAAEEGENYFVSMTDMMVGVLFIFIIMLMVFALDFRTKTDVQVDALAEARDVARRLDALEAGVRHEIFILDQAEETRSRLLRTIRDQLLAEGLNVRIDEANGVLRLNEDAVRFDPGRSDLGSARDNVARIARVLDRVLPDYAACMHADGGVACRNDAMATVETVFIEGHTDVTGVQDPDERDRRNWQLSTERAVNTYRELIRAAVSLRDLRNRRGEEVISVSGYSSTRPIDPADSADAFARNRRIDLRFVMEVDDRRRLREVLKLTDAMKVQIDRLVEAIGGTP